MPQSPLSDPTNTWMRWRGRLLAVPVVTFMFSTLLVFNLTQTASVLLIPISGRLYRGYNRWAANTWWGWCVVLARLIHGIEIEVTGDEIPIRENAIVVSNHQQMTDIPVLMSLARSKHRLGDMKWFVKDAIKWFPGVGWGMVFIGCIFVKRQWDRDRASIRRTFERLTRNRTPFWLILFAEGTRITPGKLKKAHALAAERGIEPPRHVLIPRHRGFSASVRGLRDDHLDAVYDVTIGYADGVPSLWQYIKGFVQKVHVHVHRHPVGSLPGSAEELSRWLFERFQEKDELLDGFYRTGRFEGAEAEAEAQVPA